MLVDVYYVISMRRNEHSQYHGSNEETIIARVMILLVSPKGAVAPGQLPSGRYHDGLDGVSIVVCLRLCWGAQGMKTRQRKRKNESKKVARDNLNRVKPSLSARRESPVVLTSQGDRPRQVRWRYYGDALHWHAGMGRSC